MDPEPEETGSEATDFPEPPPSQDGGRDDVTTHAAQGFEGVTTSPSEDEVVTPETVGPHGLSRGHDLQHETGAVEGNGTASDAVFEWSGVAVEPPSGDPQNEEPGAGGTVDDDVAEDEWTR
jgi:hypothetical protein